MINDEITLKKLKVLTAFVTAGNLARTAECTGLSTVSVHRALHSLENAIGCPLFRPQGRNLTPLPATLSLAETASEVLNKLEEGIRHTREQAGVATKKLRIGAIYSLTSETIPRLIMGIKLRRPELDIELQLGSSRELLSQLQQHTVDALLIAMPDDAQPAGTQSLPLYQDELFIASAASLPAPGAAPLDPTSLREQRFVTLHDGFATSLHFYQLCQRAGFEPRVVMRVGDIFSLMNLVAGGIGYSLLPGRVRPLLAERIRFTPLLPAWRSTQHIKLLFHDYRERDPNLLALVAEARMLTRASAHH
ncbi:LysR family transcriptional regulator [Aquitalea sp.]|uniref:LysR family transcriptional regulator n=1 Tax=Aquitalea sp. TaxID=1872623 RepID=UPI002582EC18|nr:LysR family transcriptional regulator [Aquitalea sp.]